MDLYRYGNIYSLVQVFNLRARYVPFSMGLYSYHEGAFVFNYKQQGFVSVASHIAQDLDIAK
jgi:hypothetical protein